ncbi:MAG: hypothetical protein EOP19_02125, partial [Hyphomicrobiales bacterium]
MSRLQTVLAILSAALSGLSLVLALATGGAPLLLLAFLVAGLLTAVRFRLPVSLWIDAAVTVLGTAGLLATLPAYDIEPL